MNRISNLFAKQWRNLHFASVVILLILLFFVNTYVSPSIDQFVFVVFQSPFAKLKQSYLELFSVAEENKQLNHLLVETSLKVAILEESARENERLRSVLGFKRAGQYRLLPAEVISVTGGEIPTSVVVNRGSNDTVYIDQPVINEAGLIGRISEVSTDFAVVQLLTDPTNRVAVRVVNSREMGIIKYSFSGGMILDNFPIQGEVQIGEEVISSGLGGIYPAGLKVGNVSTVAVEELSPFYNIKVNPAANFYSIEELFILRVDSL